MRCSPPVPLFAVLGALCLALWSSARAAPFFTQADAVVPRADGSSARAVLFSFDPKAVTMHVVATIALKNASDRGTGGIPLRDIGGYSQIRRWSAVPTLVINGGFSGAETSRSVGALISAGQALSLPDYAKNPGDSSASCPLDRTPQYRYSAIACSGADGSLFLGQLDGAKIEDCTEALQAGPVLVGPKGAVGVCPAQPKSPADVRSVLCEADSKTYAIITLDPVTLRDLAQWLAAPVASHGLGCSNAINLAGSTSAGIVYFPNGARSAKFYGPGSFPEASAIAFVAKRR